MVKHYKKKSSGSKSGSKSKNLNHKSMKGGDDGRFAMPPAYYGKGLNGYHESGSSELNSSGKQKAVSQGTVWGNGQYAGPNLFPMKGGKCGCKRKTSKKNKSKTSKSKTTKTKKNAKK